jgi:hypothetical protein
MDESSTLDVHAFEHRVPVSREVAIEAGVVEPTPEERAEMDREAAESQRREAEREAKLAAARDQLAAITDPLARATLDLHHEDERGDCEGCDFAGYECEPPEWPCRTTVLVARHYGIDLGDTP